MDKKNFNSAYIPALNFFYKNLIKSKAGGSNGKGSKINNLFNLNSFNELKKDQTNIKIFKNSSFDSSFNSLQSLKSNLSQLLHLPISENLEGSLALLKKELVHKRRANPLPPKVGKNIGSISPLLGSGLSNKRDSSLKEQGGVLWELNNNKRSYKFSKISAILRAIRSIRLNRDDWKLIVYIRSYLMEGAKKGAIKNLILFKRGAGAMRELKELYNKGAIFSNNNIISKNILLRNGTMKYNLLNSTLSSILKKKLRKISEVLEDKPIKNYVLYSYLKNCKSSLRLANHSHLNPDLGALINPHFGGMVRTPSPVFSPVEGGALNKELYKGRKFGSFINYNKRSIIGYKFNSTFIAPLENNPLHLAPNSYKSTPFYNNNEEGAGESLRRELSWELCRSTMGQAFRENTCGARVNTMVPTPAFGGLEKRSYRAFKSDIYIKDIYKLLFYLFKSMYCLISKPVLKYNNDKVHIQLFYYLNIPKKKVFRLFSIFYINSIKKKWLALIERRKGATGELSHNNGAAPCSFKKGFDGAGAMAGSCRSRVGNIKIYIKWKLRKAISRFKNKIIPSSSLWQGGSWAINRSAHAYPKANLNGALGHLTPTFSLGSSPSLAKQLPNFLLFKLRKFNLTAKAVYQNKFNLICTILSNKFNKPVELQLIRLHHPYHDSNILVNLLSLNIKNKRKKARIAIQKIYNKKPVKAPFLNDPNLILRDPSDLAKLDKQGMVIAPSLVHSNRGVAKQPAAGGKFIPAFLSGLNIKIAGRLMGEPIIPRITTKVFGKGANANGKVNYLDVARITKKNRKGAYTIKITSGQNFF